jgi:TnpA family transposase
MTPRQLLSPQARGALFDPPTDPAAIVRHYTFLPEDMVVIRRRRRDANRLGFAVHLAYLRFPGRVIGVDENPPLDMLCFIAEQIGVSDRDFEDYATRSQTRRAHLSELQAYLGVRPF